MAPIAPSFDEFALHPCNKISLIALQCKFQSSSWYLYSVLVDRVSGHIV
jgi:hypothetical protein